MQIENEELDPEAFEDFQPEEFLTALPNLEDAPSAAPPKTSKNDIYHNLTADQVFSDLDDFVINVSFNHLLATAVVAIMTWRLGLCQLPRLTTVN